MEQSGAVSKNSKHRLPTGEGNTRLSGHWLILARATWILLVAFAFVVLVVSLPQLPATFAHLQQPCIGLACTDSKGQLSPSALQALARFGISPLLYAIFSLACVAILPAVVWILVGIILVWRKSDDWMVLLASFLLIDWGVSFATGVGTFVPSTQIWQGSYSLLQTLAQAMLFLLFCLFPDGRFVPRWAVWLAIAGVLDAPFNGFNGLLPSINWFFSGPVFFLLVAVVLGTQMYRYVRVSTPIQRQQAKWLIFGLSLVFLINVLGYNVLSSIFPWLNQPASFAAAFFGTYLWALLFMSIPISIGIAMLRYRLWDIDILINRTLVYGSLTGLLVLIYIGLVVGLGSLARLFTGQLGQSPIVIVASTLAIAALFQPLRHRIQAIIDHRFYRRKYDAVKTVEAFSATLRNEVDLSQLREHLLTVVQETMQPAHVSLWLRAPQPPSKQQGVSTNFPQEPAFGDHYTSR
ncbi:MAG TPA: hypothetical protein VF043_26830 [Ktedonobacteraceae bacterium]